VWTALDDAPVNGGCLGFVPGSHRWGLATPLGGVVPDDVVAARAPEPLCVPVPVAAGESVLLHNLVWHRSGKTATGHRRLGFSACYLSDAVRCVRKRKTPREFFEVFP
jgi:ectoine hydroxylase-related dioxygenase (phytanoyl-CoA dioxygenase family)